MPVSCPKRVAAIAEQPKINYDIYGYLWISMDIYGIYDQLLIRNGSKIFQNVRFQWLGTDILPKSLGTLGGVTERGREGTTGSGATLIPWSSP